MSQFAFKEVDEEGLETLDAIASADKFNRWMYETIRPHCSGRILEIGSGIGNISQFFLKDGATIVLSDIRDNYCEILRKKFSSYKNLDGVIGINLIDQDFDKKHAALIGSFDTVFALNVVEHIYDDELAISNAHKLLKKGGHLVILVPAYQAIYNTFDKNLEHYRRYTRKSLLSRLAGKFQIVHSQYFNAAGIAGWIFSGSVLKRRTIPEGQMAFYNRLVPLFRLADKVVFNRIGLSVIGVGEKR